MPEKGEDWGKRRLGSFPQEMAGKTRQIKQAGQTLGAVATALSVAFPMAGGRKRLPRTVALQGKPQPALMSHHEQAASPLPW